MNISMLYQIAKIVVARAKERETMTYNELSAALDHVLPPIALGSPLGAICDIARDEGFPAISALVVSQDTGIPGIGFYEYVGELYTGRKIMPNEWMEFWEDQLDQIFDCDNWDDFLRAFSKYAS